MLNYTFPAKPTAPTNLDQRRWEHSGLRKRMLTGEWEQDLEDELARHLSPDRREAWGPADLSSNAFRTNHAAAFGFIYRKPNSNRTGRYIGIIGARRLRHKSGFMAHDATNPTICFRHARKHYACRGYTAHR